MVDGAKVRDILLDTLLTKYKRVFPKAWLLGYTHEIPGEAKYNSVSSSFSNFTKNVKRQTQKLSVQHPPDVILTDKDAILSDIILLIWQVYVFHYSLLSLLLIISQRKHVISSQWNTINNHKTRSTFQIFEQENRLLAHFYVGHLKKCMVW